MLHVDFPVRLDMDPDATLTLDLDTNPKKDVVPPHRLRNMAVIAVTGTGVSITGGHLKGQGATVTCWSKNDAAKPPYVVYESTNGIAVIVYTAPEYASRVWRLKIWIATAFCCFPKRSHTV